MSPKSNVKVWPNDVPSELIPSTLSRTTSSLKPWKVIVSGVMFISATGTKLAKAVVLAGTNCEHDSFKENGMFFWLNASSETPVSCSVGSQVVFVLGGVEVPLVGDADEVLFPVG